MAKIWEVDFTVFSGGSSDVALDNIGDQDLAFGITNIVKVDPLPDFNFRPGVTFRRNGTENRYNLSNTGNSNATFTESYGQRSYVMWYYNHGSWEARAPIWAEVQSGGDNVQNGWRNNFSNSQLQFFANGSAIANYPTHFNTATGWKLIVATINKTSGQTNVYGRSDAGDYFASSTTVPSNSPTFTHMMGDNGTTRESDFSVGYMATFDHILNASEIDAIEEAFLVDETVAVPPGVVSGVVFDSDKVPISGADVFLIFNDNPFQLVDYTSTDGEGFYNLSIPYFGDFTLVSSNPPDTQGARAISLTLTGTPGSGSIIFHDG